VGCRKEGKAPIGDKGKKRWRVEKGGGDPSIWLRQTPTGGSLVLTGPPLGSAKNLFTEERGESGREGRGEKCVLVAGGSLRGDLRRKTKKPEGATWGFGRGKLRGGGKGLDLNSTPDCGFLEEQKNCFGVCSGKLK